MIVIMMMCYKKYVNVSMSVFSNHNFNFYITCISTCINNGSSINNGKKQTKIFKYCVCITVECRIIKYMSFQFSLSSCL